MEIPVQFVRKMLTNCKEEAHQDNTKYNSRMEEEMDGIGGNGTR